MSRAVGRRPDAQSRSVTPRVATVAVCLTLSLSGCTTLDNAVGKVPWFTTMRDQVVTRPFEAPPGAHRLQAVKGAKSRPCIQARSSATMSGGSS